jgi:Recombination endonuclease VII
VTARRKPTRAKQLGVSDDEYARMLAAQNGGCAICGSPPKTRRLHVDHDHGSGKVRGLLCHRCNRALPNWITPDWLSRAAAYLDPPKPERKGDKWAREIQRMNFARVPQSALRPW